MRFTRPVRLAGLTTAAIAAYAATAAADPAWAAALGVDVWNVGRLEDDLRRFDRERDRLETVADRMAAVFDANEQAVAGVIAGRLSLAEASAALWERNRAVTGYYDQMRFLYPHASEPERAARNMLNRVERELVGRPDRALILARLEAELAEIADR